VREGGLVVDTLRVAWVTDEVSALDLPTTSILPPEQANWGLSVVPLVARSGRPEGTLTVPLSSLPVSLDPAHVTSLAEKQIATQIYQGLTVLTAREALPAAADSMQFESGAWTFYLRPAGRFHDGRPLRSADVIASLLRVLSKAENAERIDPLLDAIAGARDYHEGRAAGIRGLEALDSLRVRITMNSRSEQVTEALATPAAWILPAGVAASPGLPFSPIGSGPFQYVRADSTGLVLTAAPERTTGVDTLRFRLVRGPEDAALQFELGRLDLVSPLATDEARLLSARSAEDRVVGPLRLSVQERAIYYLGMNTRAAWLSDRSHRRALAGAIDRSLATRVLVGSRGALARGVLPGGVLSLGLVEGNSEWEAMAREAGALPHMNAPASGLQFWVPTGSAIGERVAEFVQAALARSGVRVRIVTRPWSAFERGLNAGQADLFLLSWYADTAYPLDFLTSLFSSTRHGAGGNRTFYTNPEADSLLALARDSADGMSRLQRLMDLQRLVIADVPLLPLFEPINVTLVRPHVRGLELDPLGCPRYDTVEVRRGQ